MGRTPILIANCGSLEAVESLHQPPPLSVHSRDDSNAALERTAPFRQSTAHRHDVGRPSAARLHCVGRSTGERNSVRNFSRGDPTQELRGSARCTWSPHNFVICAPATILSGFIQTSGPTDYIVRVGRPAIIRRGPGVVTRFCRANCAFAWTLAFAEKTSVFLHRIASPSLGTLPDGEQPFRGSQRSEGNERKLQPFFISTRGRLVGVRLSQGICRPMAEMLGC